MNDSGGGFIAFLSIVGALGAAIFTVWWFFWIAASLLSQPHCLRAGYREVNVTWNFQRYCIKREDQTDRVVPYSEVK